MASSIFGNQSSNASNVIGRMNQEYVQRYQSDPEFRGFADSMLNKTPEKAFQENGLDFNSCSKSSLVLIERAIMNNGLDVGLLRSLFGK